MSEDRFSFLLKHLGFDKADTRLARKEIDKFTPIREIFQMFTSNCKKSYSASECTTIDEILLAFRGRCSFRQYITMKPNKYGLKVYTVPWLMQKLGILYVELGAV